MLSVDAILLIGSPAILLIGSPWVKILKIQIFWPNIFFGTSQNTQDTNVLTNSRFEYFLGPVKILKIQIFWPNIIWLWLKLGLQDEGKTLDALDMVQGTAKDKVEGVGRGTHLSPRHRRLGYVRSWRTTSLIMAYQMPPILCALRKRKLGSTLASNMGKILPPN